MTVIAACRQRDGCSIAELQHAAAESAIGGNAQRPAGDAGGAALPAAKASHPEFGGPSAKAADTCQATTAAADAAGASGFKVEGGNPQLPAGAEPSAISGPPSPLLVPLVAPDPQSAPSVAPVVSVVAHAAT